MSADSKDPTPADSKDPTPADSKDSRSAYKDERDDTIDRLNKLSPSDEEEMPPMDDAGEDKGSSSGPPGHDRS